MTSTQASNSTGEPHFWRAPNAANPRTVYGALLNYKGALAAVASQLDQPPYKAPPKAPILYIKTANTHSTDGASVMLPEGVEALCIGAALGVVIGKTACRVSAASALEHVAGYVVVNDVSVPHEAVYRPAIRQLCRDGFCPIGPMAARDAVRNPDALAIRVHINDKLEQQNTTANLIRPIAQLIADVTDFLTLSAGDILLVGVPENAPLARAGDRVTIEIEQVGRLQNTIRAGGKV
jgi:5-oxopent-3-ene-1,2,5-tricarboxylate decarboxylase/2-hydroxyhepta-2,4-diene-1,7-dioate isomerase